MKRFAGVALLAAPLLLVSGLAGAEESCDTLVRYDQIKRTAVKIHGDDSTPVSTKKPLELRTNDGVCFEVIGTSTAVWAWDVEPKEFDTLGKAALGMLTAVAGPYAFDIARQLQSAADDSQKAPAAIAASRGEVKPAYDALVAEIRKLQGAIEKMQDVSFRAESTRVQMAIEPAETELIAKSFAESLAADLRCIDRTSTEAGCRKELKVLGETATIFQDVQKRAHELAGVAARFPDESAEEVAELQKQWSEIRAEFSSILAAAREADELVRLVSSAKGTWKSRVFKARWDAGYALSLHAVPLQGMESVAPPPPKPFLASLVRKNTVHLTAGFALLYSPDSLFDQYEVVEDDVTAEQTIALAGENDQRITEALILGMTMDRLDWRATNGFAIWIPQLVLSPTTDVGALGVGAGVSYRIVGLSAGAVWHRQDVLIRQEVGDVLATGETLHVRSNAYDWEQPRWYVSLSVTAPFGGRPGGRSADDDE